MPTTLAFDVYGTLIDTHAVVTGLREIVGNKAEEFSRTWRDKQLEYSFRRGLMRNYENFAVCIRQALDYCCANYQLSLSHEQKNKLLGVYRVLPAFKDVLESLSRLKAADFRIYAFSNGSVDAVEMLLVSAGIRDFFLAIVSADELKTFKPNPDVYRHFLMKSGTVGDNAWLISSNPFDVIGAVSAGMKAAWVRRSREAVFDPWGIEPSITISGLSDLKEKIDEYSNRR
ncbi:MAG: haloacid dehalogenase type II [Sulfuricaulis sp.]